MSRGRVRSLAVLVAVVGAIAVVVASGTSVVPAQEPFRSAVDAVMINASVTSGTKRIGGLTADDFEITDNGVPQKILSVTQEKMPIDVALVIDTSQSVQGKLLEGLIKSVDAVRRKLRQDDRVSVITFSQVIRERTALAAPGSVKNLSAIGPAAGMTSIYDATVIALATPAVIDRRQMAIVFTDGVDTQSFLEADRALAVAGHATTAVFGVAIFGLGGLPGEFLDQVTQLTGGMMQLVPSMFFSSNTGGTVKQTLFSSDPTRSITLTSDPGGSSLDQSFLRALDDFRSSYVLRYTLHGVPRAGWHEVVVNVTRAGKYSVRARKGYFG